LLGGHQTYFKIDYIDKWLSKHAVGESLTLTSYLVFATVKHGWNNLGPRMHVLKSVLTHVRVGQSLA
jgi:hypothetical protein